MYPSTLWLVTTPVRYFSFLLIISGLIDKNNDEYCEKIWNQTGLVTNNSFSFFWERKLTVVLYSKHFYRNLLPINTTNSVSEVYWILNLEERLPIVRQALCYIKIYSPLNKAITKKKLGSAISSDQSEMFFNHITPFTSTQ